MFAISPTDLNWFQQLRTEGLQGNVINFLDTHTLEYKPLKERW